jgi:hypothetical protein
MGFINTNETDAAFDTLHHLDKSFVVQPLWSTIQQTELSLAE